MSPRRNLTPLSVAALLAFATLTLLAAPATAESWDVDSAHTEITFSVKHFFTPVRGNFSDFEVDLNYDAENPANSSVSAQIAVASIDTGNQNRDDHLRSDDWFGAETHPYMTFHSTSVREGANGSLIATGPLNIKGISHEVELTVSPLGSKAIPEQMQQMIGAKEVAGFEATTAIDRDDFQVGVGNWAATAVVGGEVSIEILLEAHR
jgi:polyisoprenoid-binding protein YceI